MRPAALPWALAAYWAAMAVGTHLPPGPPGPPWVSDKVLHFGGYFGLAALLAATFRRRPLWTVVAVAAVYGAVDEITQPPFGRTADVWDWVAGVAGAVLGAVVGRQFAGRIDSQPEASARPGDTAVDPKSDVG